MANDKQPDRLASIIPMTKRDLISVLLLGGAVGLLVWGVGLVLNHYVFDVYFCQGEVNRQCGSAKNYAAVAANIIGMIVALGGLIRLGIYRPLLIVIASMFSVWGVAQLSWNLSVPIGLFVMVMIYAAAFGLYSWIARIREFWMTTVVIILLVVAARLALAA